MKIAIILLGCALGFSLTQSVYAQGAASGDALLPTVENAQKLSKERAERAKQTQESLDGQAENLANERLKQTQALLDDKVRHLKRSDTVLSAEEALIERREQLLEEQEKQEIRFEKILGKWEAQQAEYQKYLDSVTKPATVLVPK